MNNSEHDLIDARFSKAVSVVQTLPKTGPIQTDYEEKLDMYSLYKQATAGNVKPPRPGIWDMLGRAKWDSWAKHKGLPSYEAKLLYVETLLRVLRKYSDKTIARDLVRQLESYGNLDDSFAQFSISKSGRDSPRSSGSESAAEARIRRRASQPPQAEEHIPGSSEDETTTDDDGDPDDYDHDTDEVEMYPNGRGQSTRENTDVQPSRPTPHGTARSDPSYRPPSSLSSQTLMRYRTPMAGSMMSTTPGVPGGLTSSGILNNLLPASGGGLPSSQPMPAYTTPSAFSGEQIAYSPPTIPSLSSTSLSHSTFMPGAPYPQPYPYALQPIPTPLSLSAQTEDSNARSSVEGLNLINDRNSLPHNPIPLPSQARVIRQYNPRSPLDSSVLDSSNGGSGGNPSTIERALENVQAHIAALSERVEMLEAITNAHGLSNSFNAGAGGSAGRNASLSSSSLIIPGSANSSSLSSLFLGINSNYVWDPTQMGLWSNLISPLSRIIDSLRSVTAFLLYVPIEETHLVSQARSDRDPRYRSYPYARKRYSSPSFSILLIIRRLILDVSFIFAFLHLVRFVWRQTGLKRRFIYNLVRMMWRSILGSKKARVLVDRGVQV